MNKNEIIDFLKINLPNKNIIKSFIFGSLVQGKTNPSDCDLLIVIDLKPDTEDWDNFIFEINKIKLSFFDNFNLELNTLINTKNEFNESRPLMNRILNKKIISII